MNQKSAILAKTDQGRTEKRASLLPLPLAIVSALAVLLAAAHITEKIKIDNVGLILIGIAVIPWLVPYLKKWDGGPFGTFEFWDRFRKVEDRIDEISDNAIMPGRKLGSAEVTSPTSPSLTDSGTKPPPHPPDPPPASQPGPPPQPSGPQPTAPALRVVPLTDLDPEDPNKGKFGGSAEANGRILEATLAPVGGPKYRACWVTFRVRSTDPNRPLKGDVTFYLHPTFGRWKKYTMPVEGAGAGDCVKAWGAFTIGAVADGGDTRLELDLATIPGGTKGFYEN